MEHHITLHPEPLKPGLYIVSTPIGHLKDITLRALEVLHAADVIACEDTRVTQKLLSHYGIKASMYVYNDHKGETSRAHIISQLHSGKSVALVSDAGTPLISDPGYKLVSEAIEESVPVTVIPGTTAAIAALTISGLPTNRFLFEGFLPSKEAARDTVLSAPLLKATLVFYERGTRVFTVLAAMLNILGDRDVVIARELTKSYEEIIRGTISSLLEEGERTLKGEVVLMVGPAKALAVTEEMLDQYLEEALTTLTVKEASEILAKKLGISKKQIYQRALQLKER